MAHYLKADHIVQHEPMVARVHIMYCRLAHSRRINFISHMQQQ